MYLHTNIGVICEKGHVCVTFANSWKWQQFFIPDKGPPFGWLWGSDIGPISICVAKYGEVKP